jgi:DNA polymerase-3 subunit delta'
MTISVEHQPRVQMALSAALAVGPSHAYLFRGPRGAGKRAAARAFAAEILAGASEDAEDTRRRALLDPSPHPDLVWLAPKGAQHMVEEVRERVIRAAAYRPYEGGKRVFVVEAAEAMRDESQNALLKTLEEPPGFVHLILLSSEPEALLETISSRCQPIDFAPLPAEAVEATLREGAPDVAADELAAAARLAAGDVELARALLGEAGRKLRGEAEGFAAAALAGEDAEPSWRAMLKNAGLDPAAARRAVELVADTRRRLELNVSEELALEALSFRLATVLP